MTEQEWLDGKSPKRMLDFLWNRSSPRKLRLFVCGYLRTHLHRYNDELNRTALEVSERFADGSASAEDVQECRKKAREAVKAGEEANLAVGAAFLNLARAIEQTHGHITTFTIHENKVHVLQDIFGNPFRPISIDPTWLTPNVVAVARTIYDERHVQDMPILADALEEAGCTDADILKHCRSEGPHARGCWVVDLILGKQ